MLREHLAMLREHIIWLCPSRCTHRRIVFGCSPSTWVCSESMLVCSERICHAPHSIRYAPHRIMRRGSGHSASDRIRCYAPRRIMLCAAVRIRMYMHLTPAHHAPYDRAPTPRTHMLMTARPYDGPRVPICSPPHTHKTATKTCFSITNN